MFIHLGFYNFVKTETLLQAALATLEPDYVAHTSGDRVKFWSSAAPSGPAGGYPWQWPYIDVCFYDENATHIWDASSEFRDYVYPKTIVFPTHLRPFTGLWLPAPRDTLAFLVASYPKQRHCATPSYR